MAEQVQRRDDIEIKVLGRTALDSLMQVSDRAATSDHRAPHLLSTAGQPAAASAPTGTPKVYQSYSRSHLSPAAFPRKASVLLCRVHPPSITVHAVDELPSLSSPRLLGAAATGSHRDAHAEPPRPGSMSRAHTRRRFRPKAPCRSPHPPRQLRSRQLPDAPASPIPTDRSKPTPAAMTCKNVSNVAPDTSDLVQSSRSRNVAQMGKRPRAPGKERLP